MDKVIVFTNEFGGCSVCMPTGEIPIKDVQSKDIPSGVKSYIVDYSSLPQNSDDFFNAWEQTNGVVTINIDKAKNITKDRLRKERAPLLEEQDVLYMKALEAGQDTTEIVAEKSRLRNVTNLVDTCTTVEELRALKAAKE